jgi:hypothetical protein
MNELDCNCIHGKTTAAATKATGRNVETNKWFIFQLIQNDECFFFNETFFFIFLEKFKQVASPLALAFVLPKLINM